MDDQRSVGETLCESVDFAMADVAGREADRRLTRCAYFFCLFVAGGAGGEAVSMLGWSKGRGAVRCGSVARAEKAGRGVDTLIFEVSSEHGQRVKCECEWSGCDRHKHKNTATIIYPPNFYSSLPHALRTSEWAHPSRSRSRSGARSPALLRIARRAGAVRRAQGAALPQA